MVALHSLGPGPLIVTQAFALHSVWFFAPQSRMVLHSSFPPPLTMAHAPLDVQTRCVFFEELEEDWFVQVRKQLQPFCGVGLVTVQTSPLGQESGSHAGHVT